MLLVIFAVVMVLHRVSGKKSTPFFILR